MSDLIDRQAAMSIPLMPKEHRKYPTVNLDDAYDEGWGDYQACVSQIPPAQQWVPCSERLPEEEHWLGGSGRKFSNNVLISILNSDDEDAWVDISQTIDGEWALELPRHCQIIAWQPLPEPYKADMRGEEE